ncbi:hypothetical protein, partial [Klebsiella pneumoniae]|uniref:hypothetical protein n=1 Tax=Klebsiella pneumoniae TaxID=573 RepID=UPI0039C34A94
HTVQGAIAPDARRRRKRKSSSIVPRQASLALAAALAAPIVALSETGRAPWRSFDIDGFMGRWYEIFRTPNDRQRNCY